MGLDYDTGCDLLVMELLLLFIKGTVSNLKELFFRKQEGREGSREGRRKGEREGEREETEQRRAQ